MSHAAKPDYSRGVAGVGRTSPKTLEVMGKHRLSRLDHASSRSQVEAAPLGVNAQATAKVLRVLPKRDSCAVVARVKGVPDAGAGGGDVRAPPHRWAVGDDCGAVRDRVAVSMACCLAIPRRHHAGSLWLGTGRLLRQDHLRVPRL
jgi:hypothetical protein